MLYQLCSPRWNLGGRRSRCRASGTQGDGGLDRTVQRSELPVVCGAALGGRNLRAMQGRRVSRASDPSVNDRRTPPDQLAVVFGSAKPYGHPRRLRRASQASKLAAARRSGPAGARALRSSGARSRDAAPNCRRDVQHRVVVRATERLAYRASSRRSPRSVAAAVEPMARECRVSVTGNPRSRSSSGRIVVTFRSRVARAEGQGGGPTQG
jgi:hypothetical protein